MPRPASHTPRIAALALALSMAAAPLQAADVSAWLFWPSHDNGRNPIASAASALSALPAEDETVAAHITPEGHWQFANRAGETYTAGTPDELKRAPTILHPDRQSFSRIILSQDSVFAGPEALKSMPRAKYSVAIGGDLFPVFGGDAKSRRIKFRPYLTLPLNDREAFTETLSQLRRPLDASRLRVLAATTDGPSTLPQSPKFDAGLGGATIDLVDPGRLAEALASIPRQTAILTAKVDGATVTVNPATGPERTLQLAPLTDAAQAADVDLIILHASPAQQPGSRNWLWQRTQVAGLDQAAKHSTMADFLNALAKSRGAPLTVTITQAADGRVNLNASQDRDIGELSTGWIKEAAEAVTGQITGNVPLVAIHATLVSDARRRELDARLIPGVPSSAQGLYLAAAGLGLLGLPVAWRWWRRIWPTEERAEYASTRGFVLARAIRTLVFTLIFLPLAAIPALLARILAPLTRTKPKGSVS